MENRTISKAIAILGMTEDGARLTPEHMAIVDIAAQGQLTEKGLMELDALLESVKSGAYEQAGWLSCLCGIPGLRQDAAGYVYWKGSRVEHYSHKDREAKCRAAQALAQKCLSLERRGIPVSGITLSPVFDDAPEGTPWAWVLQRIYTVFEGTSSSAMIFRAETDDSPAVSVEKNTETGALSVTAYPPLDKGAPGHLVATRALSNKQMRCLSPLPSYARFKEFLNASRLTLLEVKAALSG